MVNRSAVVAKARKPFLEWLYSLPDQEEAETTLADINRDSSVYLLPIVWVQGEENGIMEECYSEIFKMELYKWWTDENDWPPDRTLEMFNKWFDLEFYSVIEDLVDGPLSDEE